MNDRVTVTRAPLTLPTYPVGEPERLPMFFERRVYQGSCGRVYPVPFIDRVGDRAKPRAYDAVTLENAFVRLTLLPELGGRIAFGQDKSNGDYDFFYRNDVIKPALVGLAGPWVSGGVEFNWPQHHRPGTFLPTDVAIEHGPAGEVTVWMSEHDPLNRLKGMHGICLRPGSAAIELRARLYNRTPLTQTFLWWANVAVRVHDRYESFFPEDVTYVADHAVRAMSDFPYAHGRYYGVDYGRRRGKNDLRWYKNIPVPTSYMVCGTAFDFFGGYDHAAGGGFVHVADRHIAPGKKQWTWGNAPFGQAWDRELTDRNGPYIELMAGVYTDNQPDFSYLMPFETKTFSQWWWPYQQLGPVQNATCDAAVRLRVGRDGRLETGIAVSRPVADARIVLTENGREVFSERRDLAPNAPWLSEALRMRGDAPEALCLRVEDASGVELAAYSPIPPARRGATVGRRAQATEPPPPEAIASADELILTAEHLELNRHPTRAPEGYLEEALRRDPGDSRANIALGRRLLWRGCLDAAAECLTRAVGRLTFRHPNPVTGEAHYFLGLVRFRQERLAEAYALFRKATWNGAWRTPAFCCLAQVACRQAHWNEALTFAEEALRTDVACGKAAVLKALALRRLGRTEEAKASLEALLRRDPLDHWARWELGDAEGFMQVTRNDAQTILDVVYDYTDAGAYDEAAALLAAHAKRKTAAVAVPNPMARTSLTAYVAAWVADRRKAGSGKTLLRRARALAPDYLFPSRPQDAEVLAWALRQPGEDRNAAYGLGNCLYDRGRHTEALAAWERARKADPTFAPALRNLGLGVWNVHRQGEKALRLYRQAIKAAPENARLIAEYDQLCGKVGRPAEGRLAFLARRLPLVTARDDASVQYASLLNAVGRPQEALDFLASRRFHPWEGGEGKVLRQYTEAHLKLGWEALAAGDAALALAHATAAFETPENLGEAYHPLQSKADVACLRGDALRALGRGEEVTRAYTEAADEQGDFVAMAVTAHSELSYWRGYALAALGRGEEARALFRSMQQYAEARLATPAKIDYFATSLPLLLVFEDDLDAVKDAEAKRLLALAEKGLALLPKTSA